jgi:hypothetical protein
MTARFSLVASQEGDGDRYYFFPQNGAPLDGGKTPLDDMNEMDTFVGGSYYTMLREATDGTLSDGRVRTHLHNLKGLGNHLYKTVVPSQLKGAVEQMKKGDMLHIYTDRPRIPWELVKNGGDFWGQLYMVSNSMLTGEGRVEPESLTFPVTKILNVVGFGIDSGVATRAQRLFEPYREKVNIKLIDGDKEDAIEEFYEQLPTADLIHFTGHGLVGPAGAYLRIVREEASSANFMVTSIDSDSLRHGCIVFANACQSGEATTVIRRSLGFGPSFCQGGARAFIGTLDPVSDYPAVLFAEDFYNLLFHGAEVGEALWSAKQVPWKCEGATSLVPLLYTLYGNPHEKVTF